MNHIRNLSIQIACLALSAISAQAIAQPPRNPGEKGGIPAFNLPSDGAAPGVEEGADALLRRAIAMLQSRYSISATVDQQMDVLGRQMRAKGEYWEQRSGPWPKVRLELKFPLGDEKGSVGAFVQLSDGRTFWNYWQLLDQRKLTQVDLGKIGEAMRRADGTISSDLSWSIGVGGVSGLMRELDRAFQFEVVDKSRLVDMPVWRLRGRWRPERLVTLLPKQKESIRQGRGVELDKLPSHLPGEVLLFLGQSEPFPYRIEYHRADALAAGAKSGSPARPMVAIQFLSVRENEQIDPSQFHFIPNDVQAVDETQRVLERLKARPTTP